jgi:hypothetical protein
LGALFESGRIVDLIILFVAFEAAALVILWRRKTGWPSAAKDAASVILPGAFLLLAVRGALAEWSWIAIAASLMASLVFHVLDLSRRWPS